MTRLILVHGINNEENTADRISDEWIDSIRAAARKDSAWAAKLRANTSAPFYAKTLSEPPALKAAAISQGIDDAPDDFADFADSALYEMALRIGATPEELAAEAGDGPIPQGKGPHKQWVKAIARVIERISPLRGRLALRILRQAHVYLNRPHVAEAVDNLVRPVFEDDGRMVIVAHSLGTIVSYKLLREFAKEGMPRNCPLFLTLGSPLSIEVVKRKFTKPRGRPADVARWVNGTDPEDFVALNNELTIDNFGPGIDNIPDIHNGKDNPHSITDYLSDNRIAEMIAREFPA